MYFIYYSEPCTHACLYPTWWSIQSPNVSRRSRGLSEVWLQDHSMGKQANTLLVTFPAKSQVVVLMAVLRIDNRIACCGFVNVLEDSGLDKG